jgi:oligopeptide transport system ATP-binding protein
VSALLEVKDLVTYFDSARGTVKAVDGVSFSLNAGETLGVVGESGCGKSVTALSIMRLLPIPPARIVGGSVRFEGEELLTLPQDQLRDLRGSKIAMIFQDPMSSLNPVFTIGRQIAETVEQHTDLKGRAAMNRAEEMLRKVQIPEAGRRLKDYPHQFSGGMRQRVMIAIALSCNPQLLIADEPTTALDVTIQSQVLELLKELQRDFRTALMLITHDLGVVAGTTQRVLVFYAGKIVEEGLTDDIFYRPRHPYTVALLKSVPRPETTRHDRLDPIGGEPPDPVNLPRGCPFAPRCPRVLPICREVMPPLAPVGHDGQLAACHNPQPEGRL